MNQWNFNDPAIQANLFSAIAKAIQDQTLTLKQAAKAVNLDEEFLDQVIIYPERGFHLTTQQRMDMFIDLGISPLWILTEEGEPIITADNATGRALKILNKVICQGDFESFYEYKCLLQIDELSEFRNLLDGSTQLTDSVIVDIITVHNVNPAAIYAPQKQTPEFV